MKTEVVLLQNFSGQVKIKQKKLFQIHNCLLKIKKLITVHMIQTRLNQVFVDVVYQRIAAIPLLLQAVKWVKVQPF